jgi:hypothetical protein
MAENQNVNPNHQQLAEAQVNEAQPVSGQQQAQPVAQQNNPSAQPVAQQNNQQAQPVEAQQSNQQQTQPVEAQQGDQQGDPAKLPNQDKFASFGINPGDLSNLLRSHGQDVIQSVEDALNNGLTATVIMELLNTGGRTLLDVVSTLRGQKVNFSAAAPTEGERVDEHQNKVVSAYQSQFVAVLLQQCLPVIIEKLATPENIQKIVAILTGGDQGQGVPQSK